jgi:hypothetical protein
MEGVLPERNHAVKFVAVYDDGTDSHAVPAMIAVLNRHDCRYFGPSLGVKPWIEPGSVHNSPPS